MAEQMKSELVPRPRAAWLADAKWIVGILCFFVVGATAVVGTLTKLTERETALTIDSVVMASMFSPKGLDDPGDIDKVRANLANHPTQTIKPNPNLNVTLTSADVAGKSPREIRLLIFRRVAEPIYDQAKLTTGPSDTSVTENPSLANAGLLAFLSRSSHDQLTRGLRFMLIADAVLLLALVGLSVGFGRLASPGWVLLLASVVPMLVVAAGSAYHVSYAASAGSEDGPNFGAIVASAAGSVVPTIIGTIRSVYQPLLMIGAGLIAVATLGGIVWHLVQRLKKTA